MATHNRIGDITGRRSGRLVAVRFLEKNELGASVWECLCDCGATTRAYGSQIVGGYKISCGCAHRDAVVARNKKTAEEYLANNPRKPLSELSHIWAKKITALAPDSVVLKTTGGLMRKSGIYAIIHEESGRLYIGATLSLKGRIGSHLCHLRADRHDNGYLQNAWNLHGESSFLCVVIEFCEPCSLQQREAFWMAKTQCCDRAYGYNLDVVSVHKRHSEETKKKIAAAHLGRKLSDEAKRKISIANLGRKRPPDSPETIEKKRLAGLGRKHTDESKRKMSESRKGRIISPEWRRKLGESSKRFWDSLSPDEKAIRTFNRLNGLKGDVA